MSGKSGFRSFPRHLGPSKGTGYKVCDRSGFLRPVGKLTKEYTGMQVATDFADFYPGFGSRHPQDVNQAETGGDPSPIDNARPILPNPESKQTLRVSDAEVEASIREGRAPRPGH